MYKGYFVDYYVMKDHIRAEAFDHWGFNEKGIKQVKALRTHIFKATTMDGVKRKFHDYADSKRAKEDTRLTPYQKKFLK